MIFAFISLELNPLLAAVDLLSFNPIRDNDWEAPYVEQTFVNSSATPTSPSSRLRQELNARNARWAEKCGVPHERSIGAGSTVLYLPDERGRHGNFHPASYKRILNHPKWRRRLVKTHTTAHKILASHDRDRRELDSCNSSDALLMNIFGNYTLTTSRRYGIITTLWHGDAAVRFPETRSTPSRTSRRSSPTMMLA